MFHVFQALSNFCFSSDQFTGYEALVNDLYRKQIHVIHKKYAYSSKTLLMNTLNSGRTHSAVCLGHTAIFSQSKSKKRGMHIMP